MKKSPSKKLFVCTGATKSIAKPIGGSYEHSVVADHNCSKLTLDVFCLSRSLFFCTGATKSVVKPIGGSSEHSVVADQNCSKLTLDVLSLEKIVFFAQVLQNHSQTYCRKL